MSEWNENFGSLSSLHLYQSHEIQPPEDREECASIVSFSEFNIKSTPLRVQEICCFGKIRAYSTFTNLDKIYLCVSLIALTVSLGFTITNLMTVNPNSSDFTFAILMLVNIVFCYHYVVHSTLTECWNELLVYIISNIIILIYCVLNYVYHKDIKDQFMMKTVRLITVCILSPFFIFAGMYQMYKYYQSNDYYYDVVGPSTTLPNAYKLFLFCVSLLKFDLQLQVSMLILIMSKGVSALTFYQKIILGTGIPITVIFVIVGYLGLRLESIRLMLVFYVLGLLENVYVIYKIIDTAEQKHQFGVIHDSTFACGCITLFISVLLFLSTLYFMRYHFGKGFRERLFNGIPITLLPDVSSVQYNTFT